MFSVMHNGSGVDCKKESQHNVTAFVDSECPSCGLERRKSAEMLNHLSGDFPFSPTFLVCDVAVVKCAKRVATTRSQRNVGVVMSFFTMW